MWTQASISPMLLPSQEEVQMAEGRLLWGVSSTETLTGQSAGSQASPPC